MKATIVDLRYKMNSVLKALDRNESVTILYRGKVKGKIVPGTGGQKMKAEDHPFVGSGQDERSVAEVMAELRQPRFP